MDEHCVCVDRGRIRLTRRSPHGPEPTTRQAVFNHLRVFPDYASVYPSEEVKIEMVCAPPDWWEEAGDAQRRLNWEILDEDGQLVFLLPRVVMSGVGPGFSVGSYHEKLYIAENVQGQFRFDEEQRNAVFRAAFGPGGEPSECSRADRGRD
jgi:hypothetical protein